MLQEHKKKKHGSRKKYKLKHTKTPMRNNVI